MIENPRVSIIMPVYNGEKYLKIAVDSILQQSFTDWELIFVNDCSTDSSIIIMEEYRIRDNRVRIVNNQTNLKLPASLNVGFAEARGAYFTWTSDDNILKPNMIEILVRELDKDDDYGMVYSDYTDIDEDGVPFREMKLSEPDRLGIEGNVCGASFLYRREVAFRVGGYNPQLFLAEDFDYWLRINAITKIKHIREDLYYYRHHDRSLTYTKTSKGSKQTVRAILNNIWTIYKNTNTEADRLQLFDTIYLYAGDGEEIQLLEDRVEEANKYINMMKRRRLKSNLKRIIRRLVLWKK